MSILEILRIVFFEEEEFNIPICDEEKSCPLAIDVHEIIEPDPDSCILPNGESKNIYKMKQILKDLPFGEPTNEAPEFIFDKKKRSAY